MKLQPDTLWFRSRDGLHLLAGSPLTSFTVTESGARILDAIEKNVSLPQGHEALTDRLTATGAAHPSSPPVAHLADISVVIPAFIVSEAEREELQSLVTALHDLSICVIDDCSPQEFSLSGARILRNVENEGPGNSRNTGLQEVTTPFVAFIDADTMVTTQQIRELAGFLADDRVSFVAPRITTTNANTFISEYESHHSPLDLGDKPAVIRPLSRVSYVPSAVLVARTQDVRNLGSFDDSLRFGEDVDLMWRAAETDHLCRYVPHVVCEHRPRSSIRALLIQRFRYGSSAAFLDKRHPYAASPLRANIFLLLPALALLSGNLFTFFTLVPLSLVYFLITLRSTRLPLVHRLRVIALGFQSTLSLTASAVSRAWWPLFFIAGFFSVYPGATLTFSLFVPPIFGLIRKKSSYPVRYLVVRTMEQVFYGFGVWSGVIRAHSARCLLPVITVRRTQQTKNRS